MNTPFPQKPQRAKVILVSRAVSTTYELKSQLKLVVSSNLRKVREVTTSPHDLVCFDGSMVLIRSFGAVMMLVGMSFLIVTICES